MSANLRPIVLSKKSLLIYVAEIALLIVSGYGFWLWLHDPAIPNNFVSGWPLLFLIYFGVMPLILFVLIALRKAVEVGQVLASTGFQYRIGELQKRLNVQDDFFRAINNDTPSTLTIYTNEGAYWFINSSAAQELGVSENTIQGKKPVEILGIERGRAVSALIDKVRQSKEPVEVLDKHADSSGDLRYIKTGYRPLSPFGEFAGGVVARGENVTSLLIERERRESRLRQIISTLVAVVDRRDPYASGHSSRVGQLARALAVELRLPDREIEAAEIAGSLMNFGKVLVSREILTKTETLAPDELQRIRDSILTSADILSLIDFGSPVVPTLRQVLEHFDGSGVPEGLLGEQILLTARIVAVANTFVALVSPRAYRAGGDVALALQHLAKDAGHVFDPRVIAALESFLGKSTTKLDWLAWAKPV